MKAIIQTENLGKDFGNVHAVKDINLNVQKAEIYGFLGLNGAGKTTTIRMLLGMIRPTSGAAYLFGKRVDPNDREMWRNVGYLVEIPYAYPDLTVQENLEIARRLHHIGDSHAVDAIIRELKLQEYRNRKARHLSLGNAQRLGLAKALLHRPEILLLDEPANGLDPAGIVEIRELLQDLCQNHGVTVFISSHILGEISKLAARIGIIHEGSLIQEVDSQSLERLRMRRLVLRTRDLNGAEHVLRENGFDVQKIQDSLFITQERALNEPDSIASLLCANKVPPTYLNVEEEDLESYFLHVIGNGGKRQ